MKKFKTLLITSLTAILLCFCFLLTGCSAAGTYELDYVEIAGIKYEVGDEYLGQKLEADDFASFTLNKDGTIEGEDFEGCKWEEDGDTIIVKYEDQEIAKATKDGKKLIVEQNMGSVTMKIVYKK